MRALLFLLVSALVIAAPVAARPLTILVSIDGFRADYLSRGGAPNLSALATAGVTTTGMAPSFPSLTFPNHYTLVTGLRPDHHGVVDNVMQDAARPAQTFTMSARKIADDRFWWDGATPIWVSAERGGIRTATMFWPGSDVDIQGVRPRDWRAFSQGLRAPERTDQVLAWLDRPTQTRPAFITLYFDDVDTAGHIFGPDAPGTDAAVRRVDIEIGRLVEGLKARKLKANLVVVADHGMAAINPERVVFLEDYVADDAIRVLTYGSTAELFPEPGHEAQVQIGLIGDHPHMSCWPKAAVPARFHFGTHPRIPPVVCLAETGWQIETHAQVARRAVRAGGAHGFDPYDPQMAALFVAQGPAFKRGVILPSFDNVDIYPLIARLIGVKPLANDGSLEPLKRGLERQN